MSNKLEYLIERARRHVTTEEEREAQIRSFAYGNTHLENAAITKADIDRAADSLQRERAILWFSSSRHNLQGRKQQEADLKAGNGYIQPRLSFLSG